LVYFDKIHHTGTKKKYFFLLSLFLTFAQSDSFRGVGSQFTEVKMAVFIVGALNTLGA
jgi:ABC-type uncharacterized transport system involved in gliding motility auxiliary subunit